MTIKGRKFKVRTGCITCKIRKIKCDESKPECTRCSSTGRKCDGYAKGDVEDLEKNRSLIPGQFEQIRSSSNTSHSNFKVLPGTTSAYEYRWLEYFSQHVGPALSGFADKDFWTQILPQISVSEPAIRHALLAVGASYAKFEADAKIDGPMGVVEPKNSIKHYSLAIANLRQTLPQAPGDVTVPLICCLLFICLECLYGNQPLMLGHLENGLKILSSMQHNSKDVTAVQPIKQKLEQIFCRLDARSTLHGRPVFLPSGDPTLVFNLEVPSAFDDIFEAKTYLDTINSMSLNFIRLSNDDTLIEKCRGHSAILLQRRLQEQFIAWKNAFDVLDCGSSPKNFDHRNTAARLRIEYYASFIYLSTCLQREETSYDIYITQFAALLSLARSVLLPSGESAVSDLTSSCVIPSAHALSVQSTGFTLEASLIPSLYLTAIKCRDPVIRRGAISLLERNNGREGLWDARYNSRLARRIVEIEEGSMLMHQGAAEAFMEAAPSMQMQASNGAVLTDLPSERFRVLSGDIIRTFEEQPQSPIRVTFYTRPDGVLEQEFAWEEELWF